MGKDQRIRVLPIQFDEIVSKVLYIDSRKFIGSYIALVSKPRDEIHEGISATSWTYILGV